MQRKWETPRVVKLHGYRLDEVNDFLEEQREGAPGDGNTEHIAKLFPQAIFSSRLGVREREVI